MQQITAFLINLNSKFERSCFVLTSHNTSMCSVVITFCSWNVSGLISKSNNKLNDDRFIQEIQSYDIFS